MTLTILHTSTHQYHDSYNSSYSHTSVPRLLYFFIELQGRTITFRIFHISTHSTMTLTILHTSTHQYNDSYNSSYIHTSVPRLLHFFIELQGRTMTFRVFHVSTHITMTLTILHTSTHQYHDSYNSSYIHTSVPWLLQFFIHPHIGTMTLTILHTSTHQYHDSYNSSYIHTSVSRLLHFSIEPQGRTMTFRVFHTSTHSTMTLTILHTSTHQYHDSYNSSYIHTSVPWILHFFIQPHVSTITLTILHTTTHQYHNSYISSYSYTSVP
jgi:hypothetical protein